MIFRFRSSLLALAALLCGNGLAAAASLSEVNVQRTSGNMLLVTWKDANPVDVSVSTDPDQASASATLVSKADGDGKYEYAEDSTKRAYFILHDRKTGETLHVAERVLPLDHGSNFRDIGGYPAFGGKHVRWGMIYRSGATPLLSEADLARVGTLGLANMIDLRSSEERVLAPTRIDGVPYSAVGYSFQAVIKDAKAFKSAEAMYRDFPALLAPQMRILFTDLLNKGEPIVYNCSAGQDRTGFATAMILSVLGVPRDVIYADYNLSTQYRHTENEMPKIDTVAYANNPVAMMFAQGQKSPPRAPNPLYGKDGKPYLAFALDEIDKRWGSVDAYLQQVAGVGPAEVGRLRLLYLE